MGAVACIGLAVAAGVGPLDLIETIRTGAWGSGEAAVNTLAKMTPLLLTGLAVALAYQTGLLNIGCEGQLTLGALVCAAVARSSGPAARFHPPPARACQRGHRPGDLGLSRGSAPAAEGSARSDKHASAELHRNLPVRLSRFRAASETARPWGGPRPFLPGRKCRRCFKAARSTLPPPRLLALALCFATWFWLAKTVWGFEARSTGANPEAALNAGIAASKWQTRIFVLSGALAGFAGAMEICAVHHRFYKSFSPGYGSDALTAAFLVNCAPEWLWLSTLFLASLRSADKWLQIGLNLSPNFILVVQAVLLLSVACQGKIGSMFSKLTHLRSGRNDAHEKTLSDRS